MMTDFYANNRINNFQPGIHDQSSQFPLDRGFDFRNPGTYSYPTQYTNPMYTAKNMQFFQDYAFPAYIPTGPGFQSHPHLEPIILPEIFRTNTHYLWSVKEYSITKVTNTILATIAKSDLKAIASIDATAFLQLRDFLFTLGNLSKLTQYWFGISKIGFHPETIPYENRYSPHHNLLNCTNYIQFLETCSSNTPPFSMQDIFPLEPLYDVRVTPKQKSAIDDITNIVCVEVIRLIKNTTVCSGIYNKCNIGGAVENQDLQLIMKNLHHSAFKLNGLRQNQSVSQIL
jgi:hypothetical protein